MVTSRQKQATRAKHKISAKKWASHQGFGGSKAYRLPDGISQWTPKKEGTYRIEIIPYITGPGNTEADPGEPYFERTYFVHSRIGPNNDSYCCPAKNFDKPCPICQHVGELRKKLNDAEDEGTKKRLNDMIGALVPKQRQLYNIIDHKEPDKVQVWDISWHLFGKHLKAKLDKADEKDGYDLFPDLDDGKTLRIGATEQKKGGMQFLEFNDIEFKDRESPLSPSFMDKTACLDKMLVELSFEKLQSIFMQEPEEKEEQDAQDAPPSRNGHTPKAKVQEEEEEPEPAKDEVEDGIDLDLGYTVEFTYKGETMTGKVVGLDDDNGLAQVKTATRDKPYNVDYAELTVLETEETEEPAATDWEPEVGGLVMHADLGKCEVIKITAAGKLVLEDSDGKPHGGIEAADCEPAEDDDAPPPPPAPKAKRRK